MVGEDDGITNMIMRWRNGSKRINHLYILGEHVFYVTARTKPPTRLSAKLRGRVTRV